MTAMIEKTTGGTRVQLRKQAKLTCHLVRLQVTTSDYKLMKRRVSSFGRVSLHKHQDNSNMPPDCTPTVGDAFTQQDSCAVPQHAFQEQTSLWPIKHHQTSILSTPGLPCTSPKQGLVGFVESFMTIAPLQEVQNPKYDLD